MVFDAPHVDGSLRARYEALKKLHLPPHVMLVEQLVCKGTRDLEDFYHSIVNKGGEGAVVRDPYKNYIAGYSKFNCKIVVSTRGAPYVSI